MSENCIENKAEEDFQVQLDAETHPPGDVVHKRLETRAPKPKIVDEIPAKKRKTRRGKSKKGKHPYNRSRSKRSDVEYERKTPRKIIKPEAPYNSNQFLLEDHGDLEQLDEDLKHADQVSNGSNHSGDSSFSSEGEFYSSPDDEEQFLIKDFVDQYESVQAERLQSMSKEELIQEYLMLESKLELMTKRVANGLNNCHNNKKDGIIERENGDNELMSEISKEDLQKEVERLQIENETLRRENDALRNTSKTCSSEDSEDSETDSSESCSSSSSSNSSRGKTPLLDYVTKANGHSAELEIA